MPRRRAFAGSSMPLRRFPDMRQHLRCDDDRRCHQYFVIGDYYRPRGFARHGDIALIGCRQWRLFRRCRLMQVVDGRCDDFRHLGRLKCRARLMLARLTRHMLTDADAEAAKAGGSRWPAVRRLPAAPTPPLYAEFLMSYFYECWRRWLVARHFDSQILWRMPRFTFRSKAISICHHAGLPPPARRLCCSAMG